MRVTLKPVWASPREAGGGVGGGGGDMHYSLKNCEC